jgi:hypothetical protein
MNWRALAVLGASAGGLVWAVRRRRRRDASENARWASATDPVVPTVPAPAS